MKFSRIPTSRANERKAQNEPKPSLKRGEGGSLFSTRLGELAQDTCTFQALASQVSGHRVAHVRAQAHTKPNQAQQQPTMGALKIPPTRGNKQREKKCQQA